MYGLFIYLHLGIVQGLGGFHEGKYTIHIEHLGMIAHEFSCRSVLHVVNFAGDCLVGTRSAPPLPAINGVMGPLEMAL